MLTAGAAETVHGVLGDIVTALNRYFLDRVGHVFHGNAQEALGQFFGRARGLAGFFRNDARQFFEFFAHDGDVQRLIAVGAEDMRELIRLHLAQ